MSEPAKKKVPWWRTPGLFARAVDSKGKRNEVITWFALGFITTAGYVASRDGFQWDHLVLPLFCFVIGLMRLQDYQELKSQAK